MLDTLLPCCFFPLNPIFTRTWWWSIIRFERDINFPLFNIWPCNYNPEKAVALMNWNKKFRFGYEDCNIFLTRKHRSSSTGKHVTHLNTLNIIIHVNLSINNYTLKLIGNQMCFIPLNVDLQEENFTFFLPVRLCYSNFLFGHQKIYITVVHPIDLCLDTSYFLPLFSLKVCINLKKWENWTFTKTDWKGNRKIYL